MDPFDKKDALEHPFQEKYDMIKGSFDEGKNIDDIDCSFEDIAEALRYELSTNDQQIQESLESASDPITGVSAIGYTAIKLGSHVYFAETQGNYRLTGEDNVREFIVKRVSEEARNTSQPGYMIHVYDLVARSGMHSYLGDAQEEILPIAKGMFENAKVESWSEDNQYLYESIVGCTLQTLFALYEENPSLDLASDLGVNTDDLKEITDQLRGVPPTLVMQAAGDFIGVLESNDMYQKLGKRFLSLRK